MVGQSKADELVKAYLKGRDKERNRIMLLLDSLQENVRDRITDGEGTAEDRQHNDLVRWFSSLLDKLAGKILHPNEEG